MNTKVNIKVKTLGINITAYIDSRLNCLLEIEENQELDMVEYDDYQSIVYYAEDGKLYEFEFRIIDYKVDYTSCLKCIVWENDLIDYAFSVGIKVSVGNTNKRQPTRSR